IIPPYPDRPLCSTTEFILKSGYPIRQVQKETPMFAAQDIVSDDKATLYRELCSQLEGLLQGEADPIANAANTSALVFQQVPNLNWAGFYFLKTPDELVLGPFQGKPAC